MVGLQAFISVIRCKFCFEGTCEDRNAAAQILIKNANLMQTYTCSGRGWRKVAKIWKKYIQSFLLKLVIKTEKQKKIKLFKLLLNDWESQRCMGDCH